MNIKSKLKIVLFLQFFIWGSWLITLGSYMINVLGFSGVEVGSVYGTMGIASLIMPSLLGIVADRWIPANRLYILCHLVGGVTLFLAASVTTPLLMMLVMLVHCLAFMPTIAISNSVSYFCLESNGFDVISDFPKIRVFGTVGFIVNIVMYKTLPFMLYLTSTRPLI